MIQTIALWLIRLNRNAACNSNIIFSVKNTI